MARDSGQISVGQVVAFLARVITNPTQRRQPEKTLLHQVIQTNLQAFLRQCELAERYFPRFVTSEFEAYSRCGVVAHGFARFECKKCRHNHFVAFSCKRRGFCPSCGGRRMTERAAHLVDSVLPNVSVRQWVLSVPIKIRYLIAYDAGLCSEMLNAFIREVFHWYRRYGKEHVGLKSMAQARCGSATFIQRSGSALNLNIHFHALVLDGIYVHKGWDKPPNFFALPSPRTSDVENILKRVQKRVLAILAKHGHADEWHDAFDELVEREPLLAACASDSLKRSSTIREIQQESKIDTSQRCANINYFNLHANTRVRAGKRKRLESLCRYVARPPVSNQLLVELSRGRIGYKLKRPWRDGTTMVVFEPHEFIQRLASMIPPPHSHQVRYHGVLASASSLRDFVVPAGAHNRRQRRKSNYCWAELMKRAFNIDVLTCPKCKGTMRLIACIMDRKTIMEILGSTGMPGDSPIRRDRA